MHCAAGCPPGRRETAAWCVASSCSPSSRDAERAADRAVEMDQRRLVAAVDHLFGGAGFETDLHALAQREVLLHHRADGDAAVLLPVGVGLVGVVRPVDRHLDVAAAGIVTVGKGAPDLD